MIVTGESPVLAAGRLGVNGKISRLWQLDAVRGLAIFLMLVDHVSMVVDAELLRLTLGRVAMPLFFLLAGALVTRITSRHGWVAAMGLLLPVAAPWAGSPNVLLVYAAGAVLIVACRWAGVPVWLLAAIPLAVAANRHAVGSTSYDPAQLIGLMALGSVIGTGWAVRLGGVLPRPFATVGRWPVSWYVGNVLLIQAVILWLSRL